MFPGAFVTTTPDKPAVIIGSTGQTQLATCVLGSVAQNVVHYAHCPVTVVR